ncbi:hypothetical protein [Streptomyces sp. NPDC001401]
MRVWAAGFTLGAPACAFVLSFVLSGRYAERAKAAAGRALA